MIINRKIEKKHILIININIIFLFFLYIFNIILKIWKYILVWNFDYFLKDKLILQQKFIKEIIFIIKLLQCNFNLIYNIL